MKFIQTLSIISSCVLLASCLGPQPESVAVTMMGTKAYGDLSTVTVRSGDTLYGIAQDMGIDVRALIDSNRLTPPYRLNPGQRLRILAPEMVHVQSGDSLYSIARVYGVDQSELVRLNGLKPPYLLASGQSLKLPGIAIASEKEAPVRAVSNDAVASDTLEPVYTGPAIDRSAQVITEEELPPPPSSVAAQDTKLASLPSPVAAAPSVTPVPKAPLGSAVPKFAWPVNGATLSGFGPKSSGRHNDGINIGAPLGTPVRAAAAGDVVYSGDQVAGFGHLILLRHSGGYATAYAHLQKPLVKQGVRVTAGQAIAQVGKSGNVSTPQLHFEIRKGKQAVNPMSYLSK